MLIYHSLDLGSVFPLTLNVSSYRQHVGSIAWSNKRGVNSWNVCLANHLEFGVKPQGEPKSVGVMTRKVQVEHISSAPRKRMLPVLASGPWGAADRQDGPMSAYFEIPGGPCLCRGIQRQQARQNANSLPLPKCQAQIFGHCACDLALAAKQATRC
jgi:hypothetical protein